MCVWGWMGLSLSLLTPPPYIVPPVYLRDSEGVGEEGRDLPFD
jgi:hypothetical protein